jgi:hypothetical protein
MSPIYRGGWNRNILGQNWQHSARSIAKKGYAVAGAEVNMDKYVCGNCLLFQRVKADGTFDTKDAYAGQWIGVPPADKSSESLFWSAKWSRN